MRLLVFVLGSFALGGCATVGVQSSRRASFADPALCTSQRYQPQIAAAFVQSLGAEGETIPLRVYASHEGQRGPDGSRQCHMTIATSSIGTPNTGIYAIASDGSDAFSLDAARRAGVAQPDQPNYPTNGVCQTLYNKAGIPKKAILRSSMEPTDFPLNNLQISNIVLVKDLTINQKHHVSVCEINGSSDDGYLVGRLFVDYGLLVNRQTHIISRQCIRS